MSHVTDRRHETKPPASCSIPLVTAALA